MKNNNINSRHFIKLLSIVSRKKYTKIENFYEFMDDNIMNKETKFENKIVDDENVLLSLVKCPLTNSKLEKTNDGLKVAVNVI